MRHAGDMWKSGLLAALLALTSAAAAADGVEWRAFDKTVYYDIKMSNDGRCLAAASYRGQDGTTVATEALFLDHRTLVYIYGREEWQQIADQAVTRLTLAFDEKPFISVDADLIDGLLAVTLPPGHEAPFLRRWAEARNLAITTAKGFAFDVDLSGTMQATAALGRCLDGLPRGVPENPFGPVESAVQTNPF